MKKRKPGEYGVMAQVMIETSILQNVNMMLTEIDYVVAKLSKWELGIVMTNILVKSSKMLDYLEKKYPEISVDIDEMVEKTREELRKIKPMEKV